MHFNSPILPLLHLFICYFCSLHCLCNSVVLYAKFNFRSALIKCNEMRFERAVYLIAFIRVLSKNVCHKSHIVEDFPTLFINRAKLLTQHKAVSLFFFLFNYSLSENSHTKPLCILIDNKIDSRT